MRLSAQSAAIHFLMFQLSLGSFLSPERKEQRNRFSCSFPTREKNKESFFSKKLHIFSVFAQNIINTIINVSVLFGCFLSHERKQQEKRIKNKKPDIDRVLFVIFFSVNDAKRAVNLFGEHDGGKRMRKRHF